MHAQTWVGWASLVSGVGRGKNRGFREKEKVNFWQNAKKTNLTRPLPFILCHTSREITKSWCRVVSRRKTLSHTQSDIHTHARAHTHTHAYRHTHTVTQSHTTVRHTHTHTHKRAHTHAHNHTHTHTHPQTTASWHLADFKYHAHERFGYFFVWSVLCPV